MDKKLHHFYQLSVFTATRSYGEKNPFILGLKQTFSQVKNKKIKVNLFKMKKLSEWKEEKHVVEPTQPKKKEKQVLYENLKQKKINQNI